MIVSHISPHLDDAICVGIVAGIWPSAACSLLEASGRNKSGGYRRLVVLVGRPVIFPLIHYPESLDAVPNEKRGVVAGAVARVVAVHECGNGGARLDILVIHDRCACFPTPVVRRPGIELDKGNTLRCAYLFLALQIQYFSVDVCHV